MTGWFGSYDGPPVGGLEQEEEEKVYCPEVDFNGYQETNMLKSSCDARQKKPDMRTCFGGCKGRIPEFYRNSGERRSQLRVDIKQLMKDEPGLHYKVVAERMKCSPATARSYMKGY